MNFEIEVEKLIPTFLEVGIDWDAVASSRLGVFLSEMKEIQQNPVFHGEGTVYTHTKMVCEELVRLPEFRSLPRMQKIGVFAAGIFHDIGKIRTTKMEDGVCISPHHASTGSQMAREYLWKTCGLCGSREQIALRELICFLIRYHMLPARLLDFEDQERKVREVASYGELVPEFSWSLVCLLAEADVRGRIASDVPELLEKVDLARVIAEDAQCLDHPYLFCDAYTKHVYLSGKNVTPDHSLYNVSWGEVVLLCGLPGTGKDIWIQKNLPEYPMISLDEIRIEMKIKPTDNQRAVAQEAQERAKEYLRKKQPFVWNATNITTDTRQKQINLFERYGASVRIVYLETDWNTQLTRNSSRKAEVPVAAIEKMLGKLVPPTPEEAVLVTWECV